MDYRIETLLEYIETNISRNLSLNKISNALGLSSSYLSTLFKKETGITFSEYTKSIKIRHAKILLKSSMLEINEIVFELGYKNISNFYRDFKSVENLTPLEYRKNNEINITILERLRRYDNKNEK